MSSAFGEYGRPPFADGRDTIPRTLPSSVGRTSVSKPGEHDFLALDRVDSPVLPHTKTPRVGDS